MYCIKQLCHLQPQHFLSPLFSIFIYKEYILGLSKANYSSIEICHSSSYFSFLTYTNLSFLNVLLNLHPPKVLNKTQKYGIKYRKYKNDSTGFLDKY